MVILLKTLNGTYKSKDALEGLWPCGGGDFMMFDEEDEVIEWPKRPEDIQLCDAIKQVAGRLSSTPHMGYAAMIKKYHTQDRLTFGSI